MSYRHHHKIKSGISASRNHPITDISVHHAVKGVGTSLDCRCLTQKAVPGFLKVSGFWKWVVNNTVMIVSAAATSFGLDFLASLLSGPKVDRRWLQLLGLLQASIVLP
eukprot:2236917-Amphidinium_carterae.1